MYTNLLVQRNVADVHMQGFVQLVLLLLLRGRCCTIPLAVTLDPDRTLTKIFYFNLFSIIF
jgi:hypothetical protein